MYITFNAFHNPTKFLVFGVTCIDYILPCLRFLNKIEPNLSFFPSFLGVVGGHDPLDSTTVTDSFDPFTLPDDISVKDLTIGIPKVK